MKIQLVPNPNPRWTADSIDHIEKYGGTAYVATPTEEEIVEQRKFVAAGEPGQRVRTDGQLYDILVDGAVAGDVIVLSGESKHEFTMAVYDKFFSREVGDSALKEFLAHNVKWPLETVVRVKNRRQAGIVHWLERNGFSVSSGECGKSNVSMVRSS